MLDLNFISSGVCFSEMSSSNMLSTSQKFYSPYFSNTKNNNAFNLVGNIALGALTVLSSGNAFKPLNSKTNRLSVDNSHAICLANESLNTKNPTLNSFVNLNPLLPPSHIQMNQLEEKILLKEVAEPTFKQFEFLFEILKNEGSYELALMAILEQPDLNLRENQLKDLLRLIKNSPSENQLLFKILAQMNSQNRAEYYKTLFKDFQQQNRWDDVLDIVKLFSRNEKEKYKNEEKIAEKLINYYTDKNLYAEAITIAKKSEALKTYLLDKILFLLFAKNPLPHKKIIEISYQMLETVFDEAQHNTLTKTFADFLVNNKKYDTLLDLFAKSPLSSSIKNLYIIDVLKALNKPESDLELFKKLIDSLDTEIGCSSIQSKIFFVNELKNYVLKQNQKYDSFGCGSFFESILNYKETDCKFSNLIKEWKLSEELNSLSYAYKSCGSFTKKSQELPPLYYRKSKICPKVPRACVDATCSEELKPACEEHAKVILELGKGPFNIAKAKHQYRTLAKKYHPDKVKSEFNDLWMNAFKRINEVHEIFIKGK